VVIIEASVKVESLSKQQNWSKKDIVNVEESHKTTVRN